MKKVTVVCITYNHENYIKKTIEGIINQKTSFDFELIISDDCSTDSTANIIREYVKKYPSIIKPIFHSKNIGSMNNFITSLSNLNSEYVALCDGDDYWIDNMKLQKQVDFLEKNDEYSICFHPVKQIFDGDSPNETIFPQNIPETTTFDDLKVENYIATSSVMYRWMYSNENMAEVIPNNMAPGDYFLHLLHASNGKIKRLDDIMAVYLKHASGIWASSSNYDLFYLNYGIKQYIFYKNVSNKFGLGLYYKEKLNDLMSESVRIFLKNDDFKQLNELRNINNTLFEFYLNKHRGVFVYSRFSKVKKFIYMLLFDFKKLIKGNRR